MPVPIDRMTVMGAASTPMDDLHGRESEVGISVARLLLGLIVRLAECPVSSADSSVGMTALADAVEKGLRNGLNDDSC
jgi:hypothetical protein